MTSFGWKRKAGASVIRAAATSFEDDVKDEDDNEVTRGEVDWLTLATKRSRTQLEDARAKGQRLRAEGATLAEAERYWEAISRWDEGLLITPSDSKMLEMKAQALMALGEPFAAVQAAEQAVRAEPTWWVARQTLGRAQLNLGEVKLCGQQAPGPAADTERSGGGFKGLEVAGASRYAGVTASRKGVMM
nr:hypothetical protein BaRGS_001677 [Batillaria attramentaria]